MTLNELSIIIQTTIKKCSILLARGDFKKVQDEIQKCIKLLEEFKQKSMSENQKKLYDAALSFLGTDASPKDLADDEYGCAESLNQVFRKAFGEWASPANILSTRILYETMLISPKFKTTLTPEEGTIIVSPTGHSTKRAPTGHCGIVGANGIIMSNDSRSGLWLENYNFRSLEQYF